MKKIPVILLSLLMLSARAQFRLKGRVDPSTGTEMQVRIPYVYDFFDQDALTVPVKQDGSFDLRLPVSKEGFVMLNYNKKEFLIFVRPYQSLCINAGKGNPGELKPVGGSLLKENKVLFAANPFEYPDFMISEIPAAVLSKLSPDSVYTAYIRPWMDHVKEKTAAIQQTTLPGRLKALFIQETRSAAYCRANEFAQTGFMNSKRLAAFYKLLYQLVSPQSTVSNPGPIYYLFVDYYNGYLESDAMRQLEASGHKTNVPLVHYNVSLDSGTALIKQKGKPYLNWLAVKNTNSRDVAEAYLAQQVFTKYAEKDLNYAGALLEELKKTYPDSRYYPSLKKKVAELETLLARNKVNKAIQILTNYESVSSIYQVIDSLRGKVVYLDVWGTWCGPCKQELKFTPQLKQYFKGKDVAFVYLDMDDDERAAVWKEFIKVNALTGIHLRKNREQMTPFWKELLTGAGDKSEYYPQYFIFDKKGKLVVAKAERPSRKELLYQQIETVLNSDIPATGH